MHLKSSEIGIYRTLFSSMATADDADAEQILEHYIKQDYLGQIQQQVFLASSDPDFELSTIGSLVSNYERELGKAIHTSDMFVTGATASPASRPPGFSFPVRELQLSCGEVAQGDFVILGARPEMGKTTLVSHCVGHFAQQPVHVDRPIVWVNNEERSDKVYRRVVQSVLGVSTADLLSDYPKHLAEFEKRVKEGRILITKQGECNSVHALDLLFSEYNPCLIVFDQLDKVSGFGKQEQEYMRLGKLYGWARECASKYGPVIAVSQLNATAEGHAYPGLESLRGSGTDKQGEADLIILLGSDDRGKGTRCINIPKNKLDGADEMYRHARWELTFDPIHARYHTSIT